MQQDIISLLNEHEVSSLSQYRALSRDTQEKLGIRVFKVLRNLKGQLDNLDFPPYLRFLHLIDQSTSSEDFSQVVKRSCLYSGHTFFIEKMTLTYHTSLNDTGTSFQEYTTNDELLVRRLIELKPLLELGEVSILPESLIHEDYNAHMWQPGQDETTTSSTELLEALVEQRFIPLLRGRELQGLFQLFQKDIYLPYLRNIKLADLAKLKHNETDSFKNFQFRMDRIFKSLQTADVEEKIRHLMEETDHEVRLLNNEFKKIQKLKSMQTISIGMFAISLVALLAGSGDLQRLIPLIFGAHSLSSLTKTEMERRKNVLSLKDSDFYVPWRIHSSDDQHGG